MDGASKGAKGPYPYPLTAPRHPASQPPFRAAIERRPSNDATHTWAAKKGPLRAPGINFGAAEVREKGSPKK